MLVLMGFVFGTFDNTIPQINQQEFLINCPLPLQNQIATLHNIVGTTLNYTVSSTTFNGSSGNSGTFFDCQLQPNGLFGANTVIKPYGATLFSSIAYGWFAYIGDTIGQGLGKIPAYITLIYLYLQIPAIVSGVIWFNLVVGILLLMVALGLVMLIRGGMG